VAAFDFDGAARWARFDPGRTLTRRPDQELPFFPAVPTGGSALLLDTCVYIDQLQGRAPEALEQLIRARLVNHSIVTIQEMMHTVGVLDPTHPKTPVVISEIRKLIRTVPEHRIVAPDPDVLGKDALLAGIPCRLQGYANDRRQRALSDCALLLHAQKLGLAVVTGNLGDFNYLLQMIPSGRVVFYRRT